MNGRANTRRPSRENGVKSAYVLFVKAASALKHYRGQRPIEGQRHRLHEYTTSRRRSTAKGSWCLYYARDLQRTRNRENLGSSHARREGKITIEELTGGTFSITNGGTFGSLLSTPIVNMPQSAILGMHKTMERPVVVNGEIVIRPMMYVALTYDHRIIDGREAVQFLVAIKDNLEDPARLLLSI